MKNSRALGLLFWTLTSLGVPLPLSALGAEFPPPHPTPTPVDHTMPPTPKRDRFQQHVDQKHITDLSMREFSRDAVEFSTRNGDDFFDTSFTGPAFGGVDIFGVGAHVGEGQRFTRIPRADKKGPGEWANHFPARATGPNGMSCIECHNAPHHDAGGFIAWNVVRDPLHSGDAKQMIERQTTHLFGMGAVQLLAEEMTDELQAILNSAKAEACGPPERWGNYWDAGSSVSKRLIAKGVDFGTLTVKRSRDPANPGCDVITKNVVGLDTDLVVRPFQWKGVVSTIRDFNRGAAHNELGIQAVELVGENVDGDFDGVVNEATVGDMTALAVYLAAQPRPMTKVELGRLGKILPVGAAEIASIERGRKVFDQIGCTSCHTPELKLKNPVFSEPSQNPFFRDRVFPSGADPLAANLNPKYPVRVNLTWQVTETIGNFEKDAHGLTRVELYGDLKRHDLGAEDAEQIDEAGTGKSMWLTRPLWGLGSTWPYMHDGRATTVLEAIQYHGGEASGSRALFNSRYDDEKRDLEAFLMNLRLWKAPDDNS